MEEWECLWGHSTFNKNTGCMTWTGTRQEISLAKTEVIIWNLREELTGIKNIQVPVPSYELLDRPFAGKKTITITDFPHLIKTNI